MSPQTERLRELEARLQPQLEQLGEVELEPHRSGDREGFAAAVEHAAAELASLRRSVPSID